MEYRTGDHWDALFRECRHDAFHLETRDAYREINESERLQRFLNNEPPPDPATPWQELIREITGKGVSVSRVRVITEPHSDYQRWLLSVTIHNINAGEDIRYVPRHLAGEIPPDDWWFLDWERVAYNLWDAEGNPVGIGLTTDPGIVGYCREVRERLWKLATPYSEYAGQ
ncbi:hypothetical protein NONO_c52420 [Nocardia nova SH22a]|uniref:DUF6879 domain-containing protein n=1 Tax=Nocardia nova SH22a TaxID=1415166 RepID=W5TL76_9NOCA|nr:DUF6879 family protein [Nocardia nova]AHH20022.1 hypothetical protein NONO_c52420 [Nocardia nova SH22a]